MKVMTPGKGIISTAAESKPDPKSARKSPKTTDRDLKSAKTTKSAKKSPKNDPNFGNKSPKAPTLKTTSKPAYLHSSIAKASAPHNVAKPVFSVKQANFNFSTIYH